MILLKTALLHLETAVESSFHGDEIQRSNIPKIEFFHSSLGKVFTPLPIKFELSNKKVNALLIRGLNSVERKLMFSNVFYL